MPPDLLEVLGLKKPSRPARPQQGAEPEEIEMQDMTGAEDERVKTDRARKTIAYARQNEPAEALRILMQVVRELQPLADGPRKVTPQALIQEARDAIVVRQAEVRKAIGNDCIRWVEGEALAEPLPESASPAEKTQRAKKLLHHINDVEHGVAGHRDLLRRVQRYARDPDLESLLPVLGERAAAATRARSAWEKLLPRRSSEGPPKPAPKVTRPEPTGVTEPDAWRAACDRVDLANAKGEKPAPEDLDRMATGAKQALDANREWKWEPDLKAKFHGSWDDVKAKYKELKKTTPDQAKAFMSGYWWFRKVTVDAEMKRLADLYQFNWESVGSTNLESDYDISVQTHGKKDGAPFWDWQIVALFNKTLSDRFGGKQPGTVFDTNLYASAEAPPPKATADKSATEKDMDAMAEAGQDVGALMKMRRYMSWDDYVGYQDSVLAGIDKTITAERDGERKKLLQRRRDATQRQFETADALYFMKLVETLKHAKVAVDPGIADSPAGQKKLIEMVETLEKDPDKLMAANNAAYVAAMEGVRKIEVELQELDRKLEALGPVSDATAQKRGALTESRAAVMARLETLQADAVFFAAEAYHSKGPFQHIVQAGQKSAQKVKANPAIVGEDAQKKAIAEATTAALEKLPLNSFLQSFNEQLGDFLKDLKHYDEKSPYPGLGLYRSSKYLERFCEAMVWIGKKLGAPGLEAAAAEFSAITIAGKKPEAMKADLAGLVDLRGGKVEFTGVADPQQEAEAYAMEAAQQIFNGKVKTLSDLGTLAKEVGKKVNVVLREAVLAQQMMAQSETAYFANRP